MSADDPQLFIRVLKQRMIKESDNNWLINLNSSDILILSPVGTLPAYHWGTKETVFVSFASLTEYLRGRGR